MTAAWHVALLGHSQGMTKVAVCIFQLEKVPFTVAHAHLFYSLSALFPLQQNDFALFATTASFTKKQLGKEENEGTVTEDPCRVSKTDVGAGGPENRAIHFTGFI